MRSVFARLFLLTVLLLSGVWSGGLRAQDYTDPGKYRPTRNNNNQYGFDYDPNQPLNANPFMSQDESSPADTTKKKRERKPLESYFFNDSVRNMPNFAWNVIPDVNQVRMTRIDTLLDGFQLDYPFLREGVGDAYLGNLGGAAIPLNFFRRPHGQDFPFADAFDAYRFTVRNVPFYNVKKPYTRFDYTMAGKKKNAEENLGIIHAQSISPSTGFNVTYKSRGTRGIYDWQSARQKNLSMAFQHTGKRYSVHAGYIYNAALLKENGGVVSDADVTDSTNYEIPANVPVRLTDARNTIKNNAFYLVQSYGIPLKALTEEDFTMADRPAVYVGHSIEYNRMCKVYTDTRRNSGDYYEHWYMNADRTRDSIFESVLSNRLFVQLQPYDRGAIIGVINGGVGMDNYHYYNFRMNDYLLGRRVAVNKTDYYVYGSIEGRFKRYFAWDAGLHYTPVGFRSGDFKADGQLQGSLWLKNHPITLTGRVAYSRLAPGYWMENYFSNHYAWSNAFGKEQQTRFEVSLDIPHIHAEVKAWQSVITGKVYYDAASLPAQSSEAVSVTGLYVRKDFVAGGFHFNNRLLMQWSSAQTVVPVPLASAYLSWFFEFNVVKNVLKMRVGFDGWYNTKYYAFGYNPALSSFYNQREKRIGDYPMLDAFVSAKWKRMRILLKMQHVNQDLWGPHNYFSVLHYPYNQRIFKIGISWSFYD